MGRLLGSLSLWLSVSHTAYMSLGELTLAHILSGAKHGYAIKHSMHVWLPHQRPIPASQIYATLSRLRARDLIESVGTASSGGPPRTQFAVTEAGVQALIGWLEEPLPVWPEQRGDLLHKVVVAVRLHRTIVDAGRIVSLQMDAIQLRCSEALAGLEPTLVDDHSIPLRSLGYNYAYLHLLADMSWLSECREALTRTA